MGPLGALPGWRCDPEGSFSDPDHCAPHRVEAVSLSDCQQEQNLVQAVTCGPHAFLSREEAQHFIKEWVPCPLPTLPAPALAPCPPSPGCPFLQVWIAQL